MNSDTDASGGGQDRAEQIAGFRNRLGIKAGTFFSL